MCSKKNSSFSAFLDWKLSLGVRGPLDKGVLLKKPNNKKSQIITLSEYNQPQLGFTLQTAHWSRFFDEVLLCLRKWNKKQPHKPVCLVGPAISTTGTVAHLQVSWWTLEAVEDNCFLCLLTGHFNCRCQIVAAMTLRSSYFPRKCRRLWNGTHFT